jgi:hypothetical protein
MLEVRKELKRFAKAVEKKAKRKAPKGDGKLKASIQHELEVHKNSFSLSFYMVDYGTYIDEGVRGAGGVRKTTSKYNKSNNKGKMWKIKAKDSRFAFSNKQPPAKALKKWSHSKGLNEFAVAKAVFHQGIEGTHFFSDAFESEFVKLADEVVEAYGLDIDEFLEQTLNN